MIATHDGKLPSILEGRSAAKKPTDSVYKNNFFLKPRNSFTNSHEVNNKGAASDRGGSNRRIHNRTEFGAFGTALTNRSNRSHRDDSGEAAKNLNRRSHSTIGQGIGAANKSVQSSVLIDRIPPPLNGREDRCIDSWQKYRLEKNGKHTFLDDVARDAKKKLSPVIYSRVENWSQLSQSKLIHGHMQKGKMHPGNRITSTE